MSASVDWLFRGQQPRRAQGSVRYTMSGQIRNTVTGAAAAEAIWRLQVADRLFDLLQLPENWDSYGARVPSRTSADDMLAVLGSIMQAKSPTPSVVPSAQGHFQAEWHRNGIDLEVEVIAPTKIMVTYADADEEWEKELDFDFTLLVNAVKRLGLVG